MSILSPMAEDVTEEPWLTTTHRLFIRRTGDVVVRLAAGHWHRVRTGFVGAVEDDPHGRVVFIPMTAVIEAWQCGVVSRPRQLEIAYEPEPF